MNNYMSDWNFEADLPGQKNPSGADHDLVELLWRNGQVVLHSQTQRKQQGPNIPIGEAPPPRQPHLQSAQEEETVSWIQYPMEDSFEKEFCSNFFSELPSCDTARPPAPAEVGLSHCGSNQIAVQRGPPATTGQPPSRAAPEPTATSSSGGSGSSFGRACKPCTTTSGNTNNNNKRKNRDAEELECQSEAMELDSAAGNKSSQRSGNSRKSRAAEVHNMSERRRRDRINEKMKALQELIPHSNKTDKASMLDEAIEYLKSLQLQLQVMWMGSGMTPMMFPGMQHYMSRMGMGGPMHLPPRPPAQPITVAQSADHHRQIMCQAQAQAAFNPLAYPMQSASFPEQYSRFMGFHPMQTASQPMNVFRFNHPQAVQHQQQQHQGQLMAQQGMSTRPSSGGATIDGGLIAKNMG